MRRISKLSLLLAPLFLAQLTGCVTSGQVAKTNNADAAKARIERLMAVAAEYEKDGRQNAALGVYEHILAQQPDNTAAKQRSELLAKNGATSSGPDSRKDPRQQLQPAKPETLIAKSSQQSKESAVDLSKQIAQKNAALAQEMAKTKPVRTPADQKLPESDLHAVIAKSPADVKASLSDSSEALAATPFPKVEAKPAGTDDSSWTRSSNPIVKTAASTTPQNPLDSTAQDSTKVETASTSSATTPSWLTGEPAKAAPAKDTAWATTDLSRHPEVSVAQAPVDPEWEKTRLVTLCENLPAELVPLVEQLQDQDPLVRVQALQRLSERGDEAAPAKVAVYSLLEDPEAVVAVYAASALRDIADDAWSSVQTLTRYLKSEDVQIVRLSAYLLGRVGPEAMDCVPALEEVRDSSDLLTSLHAAEALTHIAPDDRTSFERLKTALSNKDRSVRWFAAVSLGAVNGDCELDAAVALKHAMRDSDPQVQAAACLSLGGLGEHAVIAIPELEEASQSGSAEVKDAASTALACLRG